MIWLLGALGWLRRAFSALLGIVAQYPLQSALAASLCLSFGLWRSAEHARDQRDQWHRAHDLRVKAEMTATAAQKTLNAEVQHTFEEQADAAQERHVARDVRVRDATARFVDARRVRPGSGPSCGSDPAPIASGSTVPESVPSDSLVAVDELDVQRCAAATNYALSAYQWANGLIAAGVAK